MNTRETRPSPGSRPDDVLKSRVQAALARLPRVEEKRMFGGVTFMVGGKMCVCVGKGRILCRIDPALHDAVVKRRGCRTMVMKGRLYRGYVQVDAQAVRTRAALDYWIRLALDYNRTVSRAARKEM
jgi:TfoX/Sxy family transcriptional regulator of competence genes